MEREFESKGLITKSQFEHLRANLDVHEIREQTNTYLDTEDGFFKTKASALRLRVWGGEYLFSLKRQDADGASEWNQSLSEVDYQRIIDHQAIDLANFKCPYTECLTDLEVVTIATTRYVCSHGQTTIELDRTSFGQTVDYELEIEASSLDEASNRMQQLADEFDLDIKKSYPKIARYYLYNN